MLAQVQSPPQGCEPATAAAAASVPRPESSSSPLSPVLTSFTMEAAEVEQVARKIKKPTAEELELIKNDVASFVSSLGLAPPLPLATVGGGAFDDTDFRKTGPIKAVASLAVSKYDEKKDSEKKSRTLPHSRPMPHPLQIDLFHSHDDRKSNLPKLPLMKATSLSGRWYTDEEELEVRLLVPKERKVPLMGLEELKGLVSKKKDLAERLLAQYTTDYEMTKKNSGDMRLLEATARSGTSVDKVSAFICLVEDNPIANTRALDGLLSMVTSKVGKRYAFSGFEALKELFLLRSRLGEQGLLALRVLQKPLCGFVDEQGEYELFVSALEDGLKDVLPNLKDKAMKTIFTLLKSKPEQERRLLSSLVNKLGDPERKAASSAGYHLSCLLSEHPNMKAVVIDEVDSFLFRPNIGLHAKYHAVLISEAGNGKKHDNKKSDRETDKAGLERKQYMEKTFRTPKNNKKASEVPHVEMDSRLLSVILTGVNRAFPFVSSDEADDMLEVQTPILFKLVHSENFNVGVQALMLLYQITVKNQVESDRFYRALYAKLLTPVAISSSKPELFLGLLAKAMKDDINVKRVSAFSKRLLQVVLHRPPQYACGCLFLLSEVLKAKPPLWSLVLQKESVDDELEHFEDIIEESDMTSSKDSNSNNCAIPEGGNAPEFVGGKEIFNSMEKSDHNNSPKSKSDNNCELGVQSKSFPGGYNPRHREPVFCNADRTSWWELTILASHVHPSVSTMARTLLSGVNIVYHGDPLNDLGLNAFLDKFMEKKPKPNKIADGRWHGGSQIAPARKLDLGHRLIGDEILQLAEEEVPPEDVVFHRFYMNRTSSSKKSKVKKKKKTSGDDEDADLLDDPIDEDDEEIDYVLGAGPLPLAKNEGEYDYNDLDHVINDDDEDLLEYGSDLEAKGASVIGVSRCLDFQKSRDEWRSPKSIREINRAFPFVSSDEADDMLEVIVLQKESVDDDLEIFEDIIWESDMTSSKDSNSNNCAYSRGAMHRVCGSEERIITICKSEDFEHLMTETREEGREVQDNHKEEEKAAKDIKGEVTSSCVPMADMIPFFSAAMLPLNY
ncbi:hypothetical protein AXF42_Ash020930 [Apostasia shenzhenica]|uniref:CCAAT-binding factor domain-containing protein n=1 Tax=Apostasia shenzhenica TaxID=1088818 RepID=A0A2H9ZUH6_9ASPA|nr:hypothetical protein AXF42_Ash020930 [Apostasia shenzhenica]